MKTIISYYEEPSLYTDKTDSIFYHDKDVSITREIRPLPKKVAIQRWIDGKETKLDEMSFIVIRFSKSVKKELPYSVFTSLHKLFYFQWGESGDNSELMVHDGIQATGLFLELEETGLFRYVEKVHPSLKDAQYVPFYRYSTNIFQKTITFLGMMASIPHVIVLATKESREAKSELNAREEKRRQEETEKDLGGTVNKT